MNSATAAAPPAISAFLSRDRRRTSSSLFPIVSSFSRHSRRRNRNRYPLQQPKPDPNPKPNPNPSSDGRDVKLSIDLEDLSSRASSGLTRILRSSDTQLRRFVGSAADAFDDLRTSVVFDQDHRVVGFSCRRSSILFVGNVLLWSVAVVVAVRFLKRVRLGLGFGGGGWAVVKRRDRSLGGREVVVGIGGRRREVEKGQGIRISVNPLSELNEIEMRVRGNVGGVGTMKKVESLPEWWPESAAGAVEVGLAGDQELKKEADRLVRG